MPDALTFDSRGRITIPAKLRERLGAEVVAVLTPHGVLLRTVPKHIRSRVPASEADGDPAARRELHP